MRLPEWLKKELRDKTSQKLIAALLIGGPVFSISQKFANGYPWDSWQAWETASIAYLFFVFVYLPLAWSQRNNP